MHHVYPAVKAIIQEGDKYLIIRQAFADMVVWDLPGGRIEFGESPYDTLAREVQEETRLSVNIIKPIGFYWFIRKDGDQVVCTTFLCSTNDSAIDVTKNPADETILAYAWVTKEEFLGDEYRVAHESLKKLFILL